MRSDIRTDAKASIAADRFVRLVAKQIFRPISGAIFVASPLAHSNERSS